MASLLHKKPAMLLTAALSLVIGLLLGALGGGGSVLTVPLLTEHVGLDAHHAAATSLVVVATTALAGMASHARARRVDWVTGGRFGAAGLPGAALGGWLGGHLPEPVLVAAFALMMLATSAYLLAGGRRAPGADSPPGGAESSVSAVGLLAVGLAVGLVTGAVGIGGGLLVVPALGLVARLPMGAAVGTSLLVVALNSLGGLAGYLTHLDVDWGLAGVVSAVGGVGSVAGARLAGRLPALALRRGFAVLVAALALFLLDRRVPGAHALLAAHPLLGLALGAAAGVTLLLAGRRRSLTPGAIGPK